MFVAAMAMSFVACTGNKPAEQTTEEPAEAIEEAVEVVEEALDTLNADTTSVEAPQAEVVDAQ